MGNQRQQLKFNIATDLRKKIEKVKLTLTNLKAEQQEVEKSSAQAKNDIQTAADLIVHQLTQRKGLLMKEVDELCQTEMNLVQGNIESTYQMLGSLTSTLSNLESFDHTQLLNLQIPNVPNVPFLCKPQWDTNIDSESLLEKINHWGIITTSTLDTDVIEEPGVEADWDFLMPTTECLESTPKFIDEITPTTEPLQTQASISDLRNTSENGIQNWNIRQWLETKLEGERENFEMSSMEQETESLKKSVDDMDSVVPDIDDKISISETTIGNDDSSSSIVCIDSNDFAEPASMIDELSMWLKPRNLAASTVQTTSVQKMTIETPVTDFIRAPVPPEMVQNSNTVTTSTVSSKSRFLDYPGLRLDPRCWLHKKSLAQQDLFKLSAEISLNMSQKEIIPPTFAALPYPFWLKRC